MSLILCYLNVFLIVLLTTKYGHCQLQIIQGQEGQVIVVQGLQPITSIVYALNSSNIDEYMSKNKKILLKFYAPWCSHCVRFDQEFRRIIDTSNSLHHNISFAAVDISSNDRISTQFDIHHIPSVFFISRGKVWKFEGALNHDSVLEFIVKSHKTPSLPLWVSPLGPIGFLRAVWGTVKETFASILPRFTEYSGLSRWTSYFILIALFATTILVGTSVFVYIRVVSSIKSHEL
jgi:thiol-disulfide isomerase/thioredoxin